MIASAQKGYYQCGYLVLSAGGAPPNKKIRIFGGCAGCQGHGSRTAGAGHRGLQDASLGQEVPCMLVLICNSMYLVV